MVFTKAASADPTQAASQDRLTSRVWLTRGATKGLYNVAQEASFTGSFSPADTEWASGASANYASLTYTDWETWTKSLGSGPPATLGVNAVLHLKTDDIYLDVKFLSWSQGSGGFSYQRSTPGVIPTTTTTTTAAPTTTTTVTVVSTTTTTLAGSGATLNLAAGWNLLGNGSSGALAAATFFGDASKVTTVWKWVAATTKWAFYAPSMSAQTLTDYAAGKGYDVLSTIDGGEGYWVNAVTSFAAQLPAGTPIASASFQAMAPGWNLVAIGDNKTPSQFNAVMGAATPLTTLWAWDAALTNWYFYAPSLEAQGGTALADYINSKNYLGFGTRTLGSGTGFWVNR